MKLTVTLERGDAALGTLDFDLLHTLATGAVEAAVVESIFRRMPEYYTSSGKRELFGDEDSDDRDFESAARATIRWMLRHYRIAAAKWPRVPEMDDLRPDATAEWPLPGPEAEQAES